MIYYPIATLMHAGIREIAVITTPEDQNQFKRLLGDGSEWGLEFTYIVQVSPDGLAQAYLLAEEFLDGSPSALILGDNIFHGKELEYNLEAISKIEDVNTVFGYHVSDPERYGVLGFSGEGEVLSIIEKPALPASNYAVTGLYFLDASAPLRAKSIQPSARGELEIATLLDMYLQQKNLKVEFIGSGSAWFDTGTHDSLLEASDFVRTLQLRQGILIGSLDEIGFNKEWINREQFEARGNLFSKNSYGQLLLRQL